MKIQNIYKLLCLGLVLSLGACETDVTKEVNIDTTPKLAVVSFISPQDTVLLVNLQKTQPAVGKAMSREEARVPNATVQLSDGSQTFTLKYEPTPDVYRLSASKLPVLPGKTYYLTVAAPDGYTVSGSCTVPRTEGVRITDITVTNKALDFPGGPTSMEVFSFKWQDAAGQPNYYRTLGGSRESQDPINPNGPPRIEPFYFSSWNDKNKNIYSDEKTDGGLFSSGEGGSQMPASQVPPKPYWLHATLAVTDQHYYRYHRSVYQQADTDGNPFAEPTLIYTNLQGGLGVFAAYNEVKGSKRVE
ncbi:DUF4249 domain-containing protein [Adhaeribacter rhizoryzae]|uniref:DUF4249 domain-containing protein n=1 Tax=Adhaeribacter rhizoryzae TaxID=2607907 RepID=A0A5M6CWA6_9BACT|nr:DUF4249 domain-containing protein [Adhaeribacter rhizoryzae]KAA5538670.1 DUF4249 domain-containing protein [Adhaeribacter rhizoryzae]